MAHRCSVYKKSMGQLVYRSTRDEGKRQSTNNGTSRSCCMTHVHRPGSQYAGRASGIPGQVQSTHCASSSASILVAHLCRRCCWVRRPKCMVATGCLVHLLKCGHAAMREAVHCGPPAPSATAASTGAFAQLLCCAHAAACSGQGSCEACLSTDLWCIQQLSHCPTGTTSNAYAALWTDVGRTRYFSTSTNLAFRRSMFLGSWRGAVDDRLALSLQV